MFDLFKAELLRFRSWALGAAGLHLAVMGFMTRVVDLAQQPDLVYRVIAGVYVLAGLLFGLYQMGQYRRPNAWLNLLHRPLPAWQIAVALMLAAFVLLTVAIVLPLLLLAGWQEVMTARVLDSRHLLLVLAAWLVAGCAYLAGAHAMLADRRYGACALVVLVWLLFSHADGWSALAIHLLALTWLAAMLVNAFRADRSLAVDHWTGRALVAVPLLMSAWVALLMLGFGFEMLWIMKGSHPNNTATPLAGGVKEADKSSSQDVMIAGLRQVAGEQAGIWREQAAISEIHSLGVYLPELPRWHELGNIAPMEFDDSERRIRWVFSHDSGRFEGYRLTDGGAAGSLGIEGQGRFPTPPLPIDEAASMLISQRQLYQYDSDSQRIVLRVEVPTSEQIAGVSRLGERLAVLSNRALYIYDGRELQSSDARLQPRFQLSLPGPVGSLTSLDLMELVDGYLLSVLYTRYAHNGDTAPVQYLLRIDDAGKLERIGERRPLLDYPMAWRYQTWWSAPLLDEARRHAVRLFAAYQPQRDIQRPPVPMAAWLLAAITGLLSMLATLWQLRGRDLPMASRLGWTLTGLLLGLPGLLCACLLLPPREPALPPVHGLANAH